MLLGLFYEEGSSTRLADPPLSWIRTRVKSLYPTLYSYAFYSSKKKSKENIIWIMKLKRNWKKERVVSWASGQKRMKWVDHELLNVFLKFCLSLKGWTGRFKRYFYHENVAFSSEKSVQAEDLRSEWNNKVWFILWE